MSKRDKRNPNYISKLITEDPNTPGEMLTPNQFIVAVNGIVASAPHGRQHEAIANITEMGRQDPNKLIGLLNQFEPSHDLKYLADFFKTRGSNIMLVSNLANILYDDTVVMQILDKIDINTTHEDTEGDEEDIYNSEGDGYSH